MFNEHLREKDAGKNATAGTPIPKVTPTAIVSLPLPKKKKRKRVQRASIKTVDEPSRPAILTPKATAQDKEPEAAPSTPTDVQPTVEIMEMEAPTTSSQGTEEDADFTTVSYRKRRKQSESDDDATTTTNKRQAPNPYFDFSKPDNIEELHRVMLNEDDETNVNVQNEDLEESDSEDQVETRSVDSDTDHEISDDEDTEKPEQEDNNFFGMLLKFLRN
ncbi:hypothetical protein RN001_015439 [Aquatica leii]|uniref:Uncharacterized protein n=1 Tax=Aquatica leii TaxID=1421715 RepID=A0AAN7PZD1_9COLE|nr:hypothetical protein RN001_015439 [Aquatica leii]